MVLITVTAEALARAYFPAGRVTGAVRAPEGLTSEGRPVAWIEISRGARRVTLSGRIGSQGRRWAQTYQRDAVPLDD